MTDTVNKSYKEQIWDYLKSLTPKKIRELLLENGITILLCIFNLIFLVVKAIRHFGGKMDEEYNNKVEPVFKWIFFVLSILGIIGALITIYRFIRDYHDSEKKIVAGNWVSLILTILLAFINISTGVMYVFSKPDEDYISFFLNKLSLITTVSITNIIYYIIFITINLSVLYGLYKKYSKNKKNIEKKV